MGDSMDEEPDRGGGAVAVAHRGATLSFSSTQGATGYTPGNSIAGAAEQPAGAWARKRDRPSSGQGMADVIWGRAAAGEVVAPPANGRESPDSDMSSGSDVSINRGIKRMRIDQRQQQPQQQQLGRQQHQRAVQQLGQLGQQQQHEHRALSAFNRLGVGGRGGGRQAVPHLWGGGGGEEGGERLLGRQTSAGGNATTPGGFAAVNPSPMTAPAPTTAGAISYHPRPPLDRSASDGRGLPSANTTHISRSASGGVLQACTDGGGAARNGDLGVRSSSIDCCVAFPPFAPQPPAQARYVRGIRVETDAPSDVDYSNVNNALRQLHMERRIMAAARGGGGGGERMG